MYSHGAAAGQRGGAVVKGENSVDDNVTRLVVVLHVGWQAQTGGAARVRARRRRDRVQASLALVIVHGQSTEVKVQPPTDVSSNLRVKMLTR